MTQTEVSSSSSSLSSGYTLGPPWLFTGRALYQLHLVKSEIARAFIPKELKLVEAFGYTLGGLFLAHYDDSPAGKFDELVVIAGIVWNPPTSCAWAARVLVNSDEACRHGRKEIGLPSYVATFSKKDMTSVEQPCEKRSSFNMIRRGFFDSKKKQHREIHISEIDVPYEMSISSLQSPFDEPKQMTGNNKWMGPTIRMSLPSFSGQTVHNPHLLRYSCQIECRVRFAETARISSSGSRDLQNCSEKHNTELLSEDEACKGSISVLLSKPVLALEFNLLKMQVGAPKIVTKSPKSTEGQTGQFRTC